MGSTNRGTWKRREREAAALFGALRQRLSGSSGRDDQSRSDSTHPRLFLEVKLRGRVPFREAFDGIRETLIGRSPFGIDVARRDDPDCILVVRSDDLDAALAPGATLRVYPADNAPNAIRSLFRATAVQAAREGKTPVVLVATKGKPGFLVGFSLDHMDVIRAERALALATLERGDPGEVP